MLCRFNVMMNKFFFSFKFSESWWKDRIFIGAISFAIILHLSILMLQFALPEASTATSHEIAVTMRPILEDVKSAEFLAQENQLGSGRFRDVHRMSSELPAQSEDVSAGNEQQLESLEKIQQQRELDFQEKFLMTVLSWQKEIEQNNRKKAMDELQSQFQAKAAMVASLEAQYLTRQQNFSRQQQIKTVDGIQAKKDASAAYLDKFREKVELYGNSNYPEIAKQQRLKGEVQLMVILNTEGGIRAIRLIQSSGFSILDEAAKASVRNVAPFGRFDANMKDISELRVVRTWRFDPAEAEFEVR